MPEPPLYTDHPERGPGGPNEDPAGHDPRARRLAAQRDEPMAWVLPRTRRAPPEATRIDIPCASLGLRPPPCRMRIQWDASLDDMLYLSVPTGRHRDATRWLQAEGLHRVEAGPGVAPRRLVAHLEARAKAWGPFAAGRGACTLGPDGMCSFMVPRHMSAWQDELERMRRQSDHVHVRGAILSHPWQSLTQRQRDILAVAVASGYYEVPRTVTLRELAKRVELSTGAASELLRRGERTVIEALLDQRLAEDELAEDGPGPV